MKQDNTPLKVFSYGDKPVRTQQIDCKPWFCLIDLAKLLGMRQHKNFLSSDWCEKDGVCQVDLTDSLGRERETTFISQGNAFALVLRSNKPEAIAIHRWITHEVLPSIAETGVYVAPGVQAEIQFESTDMVGMILKAATELHRQQMETKLRVEGLDQRVSGLEASQQKAFEEASALPAPETPLKEASARELCNLGVQQLARLTGRSQHDLWTDVWTRMFTIYHWKVSAYVKGSESKIACAERLNRDGHVHAIISDMVDRARRSA